MLWQGHRLLQLKNPWSHLRWKVGAWGFLGCLTPLLQGSTIVRLWFYLGALFSKTPKTFRARKDIRNTRPALSVKPVFSYVIKGIKIKITAKLRLRFEDTKRITSPEMCPKSFGTFEKRAPGFYD